MEGNLLVGVTSLFEAAIRGGITAASHLRLQHPSELLSQPPVLSG